MFLHHNSISWHFEPKTNQKTAYKKLLLVNLWIMSRYLPTYILYDIKYTVCYLLPIYATNIICPLIIISYYYTDTLGSILNNDGNNIKSQFIPETIFLIGIDNMCTYILLCSTISD